MTPIQCHQETGLPSCHHPALESFAASITAKNLTAFNRDVAQTRFEQICREIDENAQHLASFPTLLEQKNHVKDQAAKVLEDLNKKLLQRKGAQVLVMLELANEIESCQLAATTTPAAYSEAENLKLEKPLRVTKDTVDGQDRAIKTLRDEVSALRESVKTTEAFKMAARDELNRLQGDINRLIDWKLRVETNNKAFEADIIESKRDGRELDEVVRRHRDDHRAVARKVEEVDEAVESQRARLSVVLKDQSVDTEALKAKIDTNKVNLEKLVKEMRKTHADVRKLVDTEIDTVHAGLKTLSDEVDLMKASQSSMKLDFLSKHVTPSGDDTLKLSSDLAALTLTVDTHSSKLKALREDLGENDNEGLRKVVAAQGDTLYGHDIQLADASTDRDKLWDRINELQPGSGDIAEQDLETLERPQASPVVPHLTPKDIRSKTDNISIWNEMGMVKADVEAMRTDVNRQNPALSRLEGRVQRLKDALENSIGERVP
ncbi:hypothetical protein B0A49_08461 [Cryomyces minteri]|uniref:Uncharacterized protein n=1 Tax=Cryomyces minteri TaxID=331657 RepID=A0A4U0WHT7_9PEZI|nr:hypothetical protein B0A49_08461 [Cryomyces minteri]